MKATGKVLKGKLLIKQDDAEEKTATGIIIPNLTGEKPAKGTVVATGEGCEVREGDTVYFADHAGTPFVLEEKELSLEGEYMLLLETQVLFIKTTK